MKIRKSISLYVPKKAIDRLDEVHINGFNRDYLIYIIYYVASYRKIIDEKEKYCTINTQKVERITNTHLRRYIRFLESCDIFECDNDYSIGVKSKGYRINPGLLSDPVIIEIGGNSKLTKNLIKFRHSQRAHSNKLSKHLKLMQTKFFKQDFDYDAMVNYSIENYVGLKLAYALNSIERLKDKRTRYFKINKTNNRVDTNLTNLPSELRQFITGDFIQIDAKNSQIFLLSNLLNNILSNVHPGVCCTFSEREMVETFGRRAIQEILKTSPKTQNCTFGDVYEFKKLTEKGVFYEHLMRELKTSRNEAKKIMFSITFSRNYSYSKRGVRGVPYAGLKKSFASVFPTVYQIIYLLKRKDHRLLSITTQKLESHLFIQTIAKALCEIGIVPFTIHDSVIVERQYLDTALGIVEKSYKSELGAVPSFKIEDF